MSHHHDRHMLNRRQFLSAALATVTASYLARRASGETQDAARDPHNDSVRLALLSDTHTPGNPNNHYRGFYPYRNLQEAVGYIACDMPDGLVVTGDVARLTGRTDAYENFKRLVAPISAKRPMHLAIGNHDHRGRFLRAFPEYARVAEPVDGRYVAVTNAGPFRLIVLDSLMIVNFFPGQLGGAQRQWLSDYLDACDETPTILLFHHTVHGGGNDLWDAGALLDIGRPATKVKALIFGHSHRCSFAMADGIHLINVPAIGYNQTNSEPVGWIDALLTRKGGEFTVRAIGGNRRLDGHTQKLAWRT
jgi:Icc protein